MPLLRAGLCCSHAVLDTAGLLGLTSTAAAAAGLLGLTATAAAAGFLGLTSTAAAAAAAGEV
jgi:hypothetical protein